MKCIKKVKSSKRHDPFTISISDLMAGILSIFILALISMFFLNKIDNEQAYHQEIQRNEILGFVEKQLVNSQGGNIKVDADQGVIIIVTNETKNPDTGEKPIFNSGDEHLTEHGIQSIQKIAKTLEDNKKYYPEKWEAIDTVIIEGHTDNVQYDDPTKNNLQLSVQRAINTYDVMIRSLQLNTKNPNEDIYGNFDSDIVKKWRNSDGKFIFSVAGYGESRLFNIKQPDSYENRRIEIRFLLKHKKVRSI